MHSEAQLKSIELQIKALWIVAIKLIKVIFALIRNKRTFTEKQSCLKKAA
jgi:hypothetical protein